MKVLKKAKTPTKKSTSRTYQAEKHLRKFCNVTSQELGNALGAVVGELDYALSSTGATTRESSMRVALSAAERALTLARNLRYFAVHTRLDVQTADVSQIVLDTVDMVEKDFEARNVQLSVLAEASSYALVDSGAVQQILLNLLSNASHAMPQGGKITVSLRRLAQNLEIQISDTGVGIRAEDLERVFEPYFFAGSRPFSESQGLGLAVAKALVEAHGGEITVESQVGISTTFTILVPCNVESPRPSPVREKRRFRRVSVTLPVELRFEGGPTILTRLTILSVGGCFIQLPDAEAVTLAERKESISLRIAYYKEETIEISRARVANVCRIGLTVGMGVEFIKTDAKAMKLLAAIVRSHSS